MFDYCERYIKLQQT